MRHPSAKRPRRPAEPARGLKGALERWIRERRAANGGGADENIKAVQIARRIVVSYGGVPALRNFIRMLEQGKAGTEIAAKFGVTRQRANQWTAAIGVERRSYTVRPLLRRLIAAEAGGAA